MKPSEIWYHLYPLGFLGAGARNPAAGGFGGDIEHRLLGLVDWLDYFVELGVTAILLGPVFESESHGYDVVDPFRIDRRLGNEADLKQLIDECHRRSLRIALDVAFNHVGRGHPFFVDVIKKREQSQHRDWFYIHFDQPGYDGFNYENFEGIGQLVKLNHGNPEVRKWALEVAQHWLGFGIDAFRLDAAYAIPAGFLADFARDVRSLHPDVMLIGETIHGNYVQMVKTARLDTVTQYELWKAIWSSLNDRNFFELAHALERHAEFCEHFTPWNFVGNHDTTRIATQLSNERHVPHALALLLTLPGLPVVYAGDEQGARGTKYEREGGDDEIRKPLPNTPEQISHDKPFPWELHQSLITIRKACPWLETGKLSVKQLTNRLIVISIDSKSGRLITALSTEDGHVSVDIPPGMTAIAGPATETQHNFALPPHGWGIWATEGPFRF